LVFAECLRVQFAITLTSWGFAVASSSNDYTEADLFSLDVSKAVHSLAWPPVLDLVQTVQLTIEEYKTNNLSAEEVFDQRVEHIHRYTRLRESLL
jgi:dTDP-D-glucose 4,6-dehydratase